MGNTIVLPTITIVSGWVPKDLMFIIAGPPLTGPLARYDLHLVVLGSDGQTVYEDPLGSPDGYCRIFAPGKYLNPRGGDLIVSGLYQGSFDLSNDRVNPAINGWCRYNTNMSGRYLMFRVDPVTAQAGSDTTTNANATAVSDPGFSGTGNITIAPGGVGGGVSGGVTQPGDVHTRTDTDAHSLNVTSVTRLEVTQIASPPARPRR